MSTLADQLKKLGLQPAKQESQGAKKASAKIIVRSSRSNDKRPADQGVPLLRLPQLGIVARLDQERGFGFISSAGREDVFFHFRGYPGRLPDGQKLPAVGSQV